jgi:hypothetical protein
VRVDEAGQGGSTKADHLGTAAGCLAGPDADRKDPPVRPRHDLGRASREKNDPHYKM